MSSIRSMYVINVQIGRENNFFFHFAYFYNSVVTKQILVEKLELHSSVETKQGQYLSEEVRSGKISFHTLKLKTCHTNAAHYAVNLRSRAEVPSMRFILISSPLVAHNDMLLRAWSIHTQSLQPKPCNFYHVSFGQHRCWGEVRSADIRGSVGWRRSEDVIRRVAPGGFRSFGGPSNICSNT